MVADSLEEILQKHFGLHGSLFLKKPIDGAEGYRAFTHAGMKAYERFMRALYSVSLHVEQYIDSDLGKQMGHLDVTFDQYEHGSIA